MRTAGSEGALNAPSSSRLGARRSAGVVQDRNMATAAGKRTRRMQRTLQQGADDWGTDGNRHRRYDAGSGAEGIRTLDPLVANQVLSQLSYRPSATKIERAGDRG